MNLSLTPTEDPEAFAVAGDLRGEAAGVSPPISFSGKVSGSMTCTGLTAKLLIEVSSVGSSLVPLTGEMQGTFSASWRRFSGGDWTIRQVDGERCTGAGSWSAVAVPDR